MQNRLYDRRAETANSDNVERVCRYIYSLHEDGFFGDLNIKFQDGEIVIVNKQESIKPNFLVIVENRI